MTYFPEGVEGVDPKNVRRACLEETQSFTGDDESLVGYHGL